MDDYALVLQCRVVESEVFASSGDPTRKPLGENAITDRFLGEYFLWNSLINIEVLDAWLLSIV
jgi:hypothetical protein